MQRVLFVGLAALTVFLGCSPNDPKPGVEYRGALRNAMHHNDLSAYADLDTLERENLYALGALEHLNGEVQIWKGDCLLARVNDSGSVFLEKSFEAKANLLVYCYVKNWQKQKLPDSIFIQTYLQDFITAAAHRAGIDTAQPFPFLLRGRVSRAGWHVIRWPAGDSVHSHQKHRQSGAYGVFEGDSLEILGFFSRHHAGVFTHHRTALHMHFRHPQKNLAGHLDKIMPGAQMELYLPKN